uniref:Nucleoside phosphorylase domain-containing protein n=1 Tax=Meloidogyne incognita TaxID=6306 RepID=A0A914L7E4_MELIC
MSITSLITFIPLIQSKERNLIRIERTHEIPTNVCLVASGPFEGIIINKLVENYEELPTQFPCSFSVWISSDGGKTLKQEIRSFRFCFFNNIQLALRAETSQRFIKNIFERNFPKDYVSFFKLLLRLMKEDYPQLRAIDVEMKFAAGSEKMAMPNAKQFINDGELENLTSSHVKEALEHAYPNSVTEEDLAESLRCSVEEIRHFLSILEKEGHIEQLPNQVGEWIRKAYIPEPQHNIQDKHPQTVAIITCLFPEKQSVDTIIENRTTKHSYSKTGDSNVYTIGKIAGHNVVATKLSMIGGDRMAATSAGSITTRLLGAFQHVEHVIIVGIGGGVPHYTDPEMHIRLGDVVISDSGIDDSNKRQIGSYVYAHNINCNWKTGEIEGLVVRDWLPKDNVLARTVRNGQKQDLLKDWHSNSKELISRLNEEHKDQQLDFSRPHHETDVLTMLTAEGNIVVFPHPNASRIDPLFHLGPVGSMFTLAQKPPKSENEVSSPTQSSPLKSAKRQNSSIKNGQNGTNSEKENVEEKEGDVNQLNISNNSEESAGLVNAQVNQQLRERFISEYHVRAYDAGFDSVIAAIEGSRVDSWVLIRGVADYQQGATKIGKLWQHYASANAAAMVKTILGRIPATR